MMKTKRVLLIFALFYAGVYSKPGSTKFKVEKVSGIEGEIGMLNCGSDDFCYVTASKKAGAQVTSKLHTISSEKKILKTYEFKKIEAVSVDDKNTIYLFESNENPAQPTKRRYVLHMKKNDWTDFTIIYAWEMGVKKKLTVLLDKHDYLFATMEHGPVVFKPGRNVPIALYINTAMGECNAFKADFWGNVFFLTGGSNKTYTSAFQIVKEAPNVKIPQAKSIANLVSDAQTEINSLGTNTNGGVFFATSNIDSDPPSADTRADITKLNGSQLHPILAQFRTKFRFICTTKDRLYFISRGIAPAVKKQTSNTFINYVDGEDEVTAIRPSLNIAVDSEIEEDKCKEDSDGNVFIPSNKSILKIEKGKLKLSEIVTDSARIISSILIDQSNDLWVVGGEKLYFMKKGSTKVETVVDIKLHQDFPSVLEENKRQAEILVGTKDGLWTVSKEKVKNPGDRYINY